MDGSIGNHFSRGRRLRPATREFAIESFPKLILRLKQNRLTITLDQSAGNASLVILRNRNSNYEFWHIVQEDFDICKNIASKVQLRLFPTDNEDVVLSKIRSYIAIEFASR